VFQYCKFENGKLSRDSFGPESSSLDLASKTFEQSTEEATWPVVAFVERSFRLGGDGDWHQTAETIVKLDVL